MNFLLDTHAFLWFINGDAELSKEARDIIENSENTKFISIATFWEIAIKINIGKLQLDMPFQELEYHASINGFRLLPITFRHTNKIINLPLHHKDPFDRIIIAQASCDNLSIIGKDPYFQDYDVNMSW
ncbi:type II toxin-antitoxin system VapC family toxin [Dyadobacter sp. CY312]|uniref:type II toxin-antitoxin system VapC family toxin n=1 Tax=Dyadobacter sp. CY312 TaxID=2907303 RepID=UPI001F2A30C7|nr:type II toxin-antitoxin system VapC family toxin [Dyadobacter sp. CY312]MCE7040611.1 type II toxin-antitoxin system VapC family toxin [Dyadobacter sp. CY312]